MPWPTRATTVRWCSAPSTPGVLTLTLNRGERFNPLSSATIAALDAELEAAAGDARGRARRREQRARAYDVTSEVMARNMLLDDASEGIDAFLGKRVPAWQGR